MSEEEEEEEESDLCDSLIVVSVHQMNYVYYLK